MTESEKVICVIGHMLLGVNGYVVTSMIICIIFPPSTSIHASVSSIEGILYGIIFCSTIGWFWGKSDIKRRKTDE